MAVHCGVCAVRISSAPDNGGSFPSDDFGGWYRSNRYPGGSRIDDTCESCAARLRIVVAREALRIRSLKHNAPRVEALRRETAEREAEQKRYEEERRTALAGVDRRFGR